MKNIHYDPIAKRWDNNTLLLEGNCVYQQRGDWYNTVLIGNKIVRRGPFRNESEARGDLKATADRENQKVLV